MSDPTLDTRSVSSQGRRAIVVLLVDDQAFVGAAVSLLLESEPDIEVHSCLSAVNAIARANEIAPTLILQDLVMPEIDGLTLVRAFRANPQTAGTPVIVRVPATFYWTGNTNNQPEQIFVYHNQWLWGTSFVRWASRFLLVERLQAYREV